MEIEYYSDSDSSSIPVHHSVYNPSTYDTGYLSDDAMDYDGGKLPLYDGTKGMNWIYFRDGARVNYGKQCRLARRELTELQKLDLLRDMIKPYSPVSHWVIEKIKEIKLLWKAKITQITHAYVAYQDAVRAYAAAHAADAEDALPATQALFNAIPAIEPQDPATVDNVDMILYTAAEMNVKSRLTEDSFEPEEPSLFELMLALGEKKYGAAANSEINGFWSQSMGKGQGVNKDEDPEGFGTRVEIAYDLPTT